jgi:hypothetical protein
MLNPSLMLANDSTLENWKTIFMTPMIINFFAKHINDYFASLLILISYWKISLQKNIKYGRLVITWRSISKTQIVCVPCVLLKSTNHLFYRSTKHTM